jgi:hypothetical protein
VLFLFFAALWAQIDFLNLIIPSTAPTACQATLVFSTMSDQLARVGMEQFLLWSVGHGTKATAERLILQAILGVRLVAGGLLVGFTRPDFAPVCVARTSLMPISILVITLDFVIIGVLFIRALALGMFRDLPDKRSSTLQEQSKALTLTIVGFTVWTGVSLDSLDECGVPLLTFVSSDKRTNDPRQPIDTTHCQNASTCQWPSYSRWYVPVGPLKSCITNYS